MCIRFPSEENRHRALISTAGAIWTKHLANIWICRVHLRRTAANPEFLDGKRAQNTLFWHILNHISKTARGISPPETVYKYLIYFLSRDIWIIFMWWKKPPSFFHWKVDSFSSFLWEPVLQCTALCTTLAIASCFRVKTHGRNKYLIGNFPLCLVI